MKYACIFFILLLGLPLKAEIQLKNIDYYKSVNFRIGRTVETRQLIQLSHSGDTEEFFITFSAGQSGDPYSRELRNAQGDSSSYLLQTPLGDPLMDLEHSAAESNLLTGIFQQGKSIAQLEYFFIIPGESFAPAYFINDVITVSIYSGNLQNYSLITSVSIELAANVTQEVSLSVVSPGGFFDESMLSGTLDFGRIIPGARQYGDILVRANVPYTLSLESLNQGYLAPVIATTGAQIPYSMAINGLHFSLNNGPVILDNPAMTELQGERFSLEFMVGDFWDVPAGIFEDSITLTVSAY